MTTWVVRAVVALLLVAAVAALIAGIDGWISGIRKDAFKAGDTAGAARVQAKWDEDRAQAQAQRIADAAAAAKETQRRLERQSENEREQAKALATARADAERARGAVDRLQLRAASYLDAAGCGTLTGDSALACVRQAAARLGDALGQCGAIARRVAEAADDARARGQLCEADYDALTLKAAQP